MTKIAKHTVNTTAYKEILESETGRRNPLGIARIIFLCTALGWSLFQLWIASPLPYLVNLNVPSYATRPIHLTFTLILAFMLFPNRKRNSIKYGTVVDRITALILAGSIYTAYTYFFGFNTTATAIAAIISIITLLAPRKKTKNLIPITDWVLTLSAASCVGYYIFFYETISSQVGNPSNLDIAVSCLGIVLLLEATRRVMGLPMVCVAIIFLLYVFVGPYMPDMIQHKGASLSRAASHMWLTTEGVFGVPLDVSTNTVFLYVLFGAMLETVGAGAYLTNLSFALLGHLRGGPAKAAVLASGFHGLISGSSIANVLTCGPVTILLMKKVGFSAEKAGAVEVAAGSNGQIMPPVMGAAAFLMIEFVGISYSELIRCAFLPAILAYASLLYIVHIEAVKLNMKGIPRITPFKARMIGWGLTISSITILIGILYFLLTFVAPFLGDYSWLFFGGLLVAAYLASLYYSNKQPPLEGTTTNNFQELPPIKRTLFSGLHYLLPIAVLIWCLVVQKMSPGLSAFYACMFITIIQLTQGTLNALFHKNPIKPAFYSSVKEYFKSLIKGARSMVTIGLATATAGIIVGSVSLTGIGQVLASVVEALSMGYLPLVLILTAVFSLILGMGLPTTANYIIVSSLLAPVIYQLAASHGLEVPLVSVHLFVFYFGIMADATPPVALAAFAASGISGGDPLKTGIQGFIYEMRTAILPFVFIYNPELLLINVTSFPHIVWIVITSGLACMAFASITQRFMLTKTRWWEICFLICAVILLFRPSLLRDYLFPPYEFKPATEIQSVLPTLNAEKPMRLHISINDEKEVKSRVFLFPVSKTNPAESLAEVGLDTKAQGNNLLISDVGFNSAAETAGLSYEHENIITGIDIPKPQPPKAPFAAIGIALFVLTYLSQKARIKRKKQRKLAATAAAIL